MTRSPYSLRFQGGADRRRTVRLVTVSERLERVLDPAFVENLTELETAEVRSRRAEGSEVEVGLSYVRRLAQGRLDILVAELQRRAMGDPNHRLDDLVAQLGEILTGDRSTANGNGRFPALMAPAADDELAAELEAVLSDATMGDLPALSDEQAITLGERLRDFESRISEQRREVHSQLGLLEKEIVRRYKSGEATVDSLLSS